MLSDDARELITLDNGARIVLDPMPWIATAAVNVSIDAGARHEPAALNGLAHFLEHMVFKGAGGLSARELVEFVEARGGALNASTGHERTSYTIRCLKDDASDMLAHVLKLVCDADLPARELDLERQVILQEIGEAYDELDDRVMEMAQAAAWPDHALGRPILGVEETLADIHIDDLRAFTHRLYRPERIVVSISGAFDRDACIEIAQKRLSSLTRGDETAVIRPDMASGVRFEARESEQSLLVLSNRAPSLTDPLRFAARLLTEILGGGMASRLYQEVREQRGIAYAIDAYIDAYTDAGRIDVFCGCAPEDAFEVQAIVKDSMNALIAEGPTQEELSRAKAVSIASIAMSLESASSRAASSAYELLVLNELVPVKTAIDHIHQVDVDHIMQVAQTAQTGPRIAAGIGEAQIAHALNDFVSDVRT